MWKEEEAHSAFKQDHVCSCDGPLLSPPLWMAKMSAEGIGTWPNRGYSSDFCNLQGELGNVVFHQETIIK